MIDVRDALSRLLDAAASLPPVEMTLERALGRTLAETVEADRDFPPTDRSAMDGFAVRAGDAGTEGGTLRVVGEIRAGQDPRGIDVGAGEAARIFTGGVIPKGADAVVMVEATQEDARSGTVLVKEGAASGQHVRRRGEDLRAGEAVVRSGSVLRSAEMAAMAAVGRTRVRVVRPPSVAVLSTGDEVVESEVEPAPHQVRNSNARMLLAELASRRIEARYLGIAKDEPDALRTAIGRGLTGDLLILTGGVSVGAYDHVRDTLAAAGCEVLFQDVAMRPGKPIVAARRGSCLVLGLPGNPVSAFTGLQVFVLPAIRKMMGDPHPLVEPVHARLLAPLSRKPGRLTYHLALLTWRAGEPTVTPVASTSSGDVLSLARANAFIVTAADSAAIPAGAFVGVVPWS